MAAPPRRDGERAAAALWAAGPSVNLVLVAHADDAEAYFGATMLHLVDRGEKVFIVVASDGALGSARVRSSSRSVASSREKEQREAARRAGVSGVYFLGLPDCGLQSCGPRLKERFSYFIRKLRPDAVFTFDPTPFYFPREKAHAGSCGVSAVINHSDHRAVGEAALDAVSCGSAVPRYAPSRACRALPPWSVDDLFLANAPRPNVAVDVFPYLERKEALLSAYRSQAISDWIQPAVESEKAFYHIALTTRSARRKPRSDFFKPVG